jgi:hypothetical protein
MDKKKWITSKEAADLLTGTSGHQISDAYVRRLGNTGKLSTMSIDARTKLYKKADVEAYTVKLRGTGEVRKAIREKREAKEQNPIIEKPATVPVETLMPIDIHMDMDVQKDIVAPNTGDAPKSDIPAHLPPGTLLMTDFAEAHGVRKERMREWIGEGLKGERIETTLVMVKRPNGGSRTHFMTPEQQEKALDFLRRHGKLKTSQPEPEEKPGAEEHPWWSPDGEEPFN